MRAVDLAGHGDESVLRIADLPEPPLGPGDVRIAVAATAVNRADLLQRRGMYPPPPGASEILGLECAGTVVETGAGVLRPAVGDRVMALLAGGGYAAQAVAPAGSVMRIPDSLSFEQAAAVPEVFLTAFLNLVLLGGLEDRHIVLVHGGSGGVGTAAIQLARTVGARCIVTAGGPDRCGRCVALGADHAIDHRRGTLEEDLRAVLGDDRLDLVLDCVGAPYLATHLALMAVDGRLVLIGLMGGGHGEIDLVPVLRKRLRIVGSTLRSRSPAEKASIVDAFADRFWGLLADGSIAPVVDRVLPIEEIAEAHRALASGDAFGKIVLTF